MSRSRINFAPRTVESPVDGPAAGDGPRSRRSVPPLLPPAATRAPLLPTPPMSMKNQLANGSADESFTRNRVNGQPLPKSPSSEVGRRIEATCRTPAASGISRDCDESKEAVLHRRASPPPADAAAHPPPPAPPAEGGPSASSSSSSLASLIPPTVHAATVGTSRNFIGLLNEAFQRRKVTGRFEFEEVEKSGPSHKPVFTYAITVNEDKYTGTATTKQEAKQNAAWAALQGNRLLPNASNDGGSQSDKAPKTLPKHPLCILNELFPGLEGFDSKVVPVPIGTETYFRATLCFNETEFTGDIAKTKKGARTLAANKVLYSLFGNDYVAEGFDAGKIEEKPGAPQTHLEVPWLSMPPLGPHDVIAKAVFEKFFEIIAPYPLFAKWKVIAGVAYTTRDGNCQVISIASGTKCVSGEKASLQGQSVNDCHAEVLARRGFVRYLYDQLSRVVKGQESLLIQAAPRGGYELRPGIDIHLVISTSPCGDGRIFAPFDRASSRTRGCLRVKVEAGMGTIPVRSFNSVQTWDGVMEGERLLTMSCSDKLCRRNILGIQGSLLSQFVAPIYFKSIIVGSMCNIPHLQRALIDRLAQGLNCRKLRIPEPFHLNRPQIVPTCYQAPREPGTKAPNHAVNWIVEESVEIIDASTGRVLHTRIPSRLCKRNFFQLWSQLNKERLINSSSFPEDNNNYLPSAVPNYRDAKNAAFIYSVAKKTAMSALLDGGCGKWVSKPQEGSSFFLDDVDDGGDLGGDGSNNHLHQPHLRDGSAC